MSIHSLDVVWCDLMHQESLHRVLRMVVMIRQDLGGPRVSFGVVLDQFSLFVTDLASVTFPSL